MLSERALDRLDRVDATKKFGCKDRLDPLAGEFLLLEVMERRWPEETEGSGRSDSGASVRREGEVSSEEEISLHCTVLSAEDDEEGEDPGAVGRAEGPAWKSHSGPEGRDW